MSLPVTVALRWACAAVLKQQPPWAFRAGGHRREYFRRQMGCSSQPYDGSDGITHQINRKWARRQSKRFEFAFTMNRSKIYLYIEQFSLKSNWRIAERCPYNQQVTKIKNENSLKDLGKIHIFFKCTYNGLQGWSHTRLQYVSTNFFNLLFYIG